MRRLPRIVSLLVALVFVAPVLAGCENFDPDSLDPFGLNQKKPLPGKRELLFPGGVPGVAQGIPPEYRAGYQAPGSQDLTFDGTEGQQAPGGAAAPAARTATRAPSAPVRQSSLGKPLQVHKPAAKPKRRVVKPKPRAKPKPKPAETASKPQATESPWPSTTQQKSTQQGTAAPWPSQQPQQKQGGWPAAEDQKLAPWPSAPPSGTFSK